VIAVLNMALFTRKPQGVIHNSDQGSQYTSLDFDKRCKEMGVRDWKGSVGDAYDNAMAESFFVSLQCELIDRCRWKTFTATRMASFTWIEAWYNPHRRHKGLGQKSLNNFEKALKDQTTPTTAPEDGLPNGCFAPVDKPSEAPMKGL
jgi:putative transposase